MSVNALYVYLNWPSYLRQKYFLDADNYCGHSQPCSEGVGDCDHDDECEGSLICANCATSGPPGFDCCRKKSDNTESNFCTSAQPCIEGEGGCKRDYECEGSLLCGYSNCANGTVDNCCTPP